ncbi:MAG: transposase [Chloroflexi bacterium]|nr:transposase [Chloroflexota bacterium]
MKRTILEVCETRGWNLFAINVRTNHVHVVVTATAPPERVLNDFKAWCTRRLRECGLASPGVHIWSRHGSTRHLWTDEHVAVAKHYVLYEQDHARPHA